MALLEIKNLHARVATGEQREILKGVDLTINVDANSIQLTPAGEKWTGEVDVIVAETLRGNAPTLSFSTTLTIDVT